jgi:hypothetical protein
MIFNLESHLIHGALILEASRLNMGEARGEFQNPGGKQPRGFTTARVMALA